MRISHFVNLTKPKIVVLFLVTGLVAIMLEGGEILADPWALFFVSLGMACTAASANAFNMFVDSDIDCLMERTRHTRVIPRGLVSENKAFIFGLVLAVAALLSLGMAINFLSAFLALFTILFYVLIYTMWLKRTTHHNTVIGGVAGATAPLMGSAAATGEISLLAWSLFSIIFLWSAPHFWALAITLKDDYAKAKIPMLPVKYGEARTRREIFIYTLFLMPISFLPWFIGRTSDVYAVVVACLGIMYLWQTVRMMQIKTHRACKNLFWVSLIYLTLLFAALVVDILVLL